MNTETNSNSNTSTSNKYISWGKKLIIAIDCNNFQRFVEIFDSLQSYGITINEQIDINGLLGYRWTYWLSSYLGDTLLHFSLKLKKLSIIHIILLRYQPNLSITNNQNETSNDICQRIFGHSINQFLGHNTIYYFFKNYQILKLNLKTFCEEYIPQDESIANTKDWNEIYHNLPKTVLNRILNQK